MPRQPSERRLHPLSFLFELAAHVRQLVLPGLFVLIAGARGSDTWQVYLMLLFVPFALVSVARALVFRYVLEPEELTIRSGLLFKQERRIPYGRIQNIDAIQNIVHRALRVVDVRLETAGGNEPEAHLRVVATPALDELRAQVREARARARHDAGEAAAAGAPAAGTATQDATILLRLTTGDLVVSGLIQGRGLIVIGAVFGLLWEAGLTDRIMGRLFGDAVQDRDAARSLVGALFGQGVPPLEKVLIAVAAFAALIVVTRLISIAWALVRLHGFTLRKAGGDLRTDFGLVTRVTATIPMRRIQTVTVHEGPVHRLFGRVSVHVDTAGGRSGEEVHLQRQWLAPVVPRAAVASLLDDILPAVPSAGVAWQPVEARGVRRARVRLMTVAAVASLLFVGLLGWWTLAVFAGFALLAELNARRSVRALGWSLGEGGVHFRSGWIWRRRTVAPFSKVQAVSLDETPFDRRLAMARVAVDTAGTGQDRHQIRVPYLARATAASLAGALARQAARTRFRW